MKDPVLNKIALFRDGKLVKLITPGTLDAGTIAINGELIRLRHTAPYFNRSNIVQEFAEMFRYSGFTCPCCDTAVYNSENYLKAPGWFLGRLQQADEKQNDAAAKQVGEEFDRRTKQ